MLANKYILRYIFNDSTNVSEISKFVRGIISDDLKMNESSRIIEITAFSNIEIEGINKSLHRYVNQLKEKYILECGIEMQEEILEEYNEGKDSYDTITSALNLKANINGIYFSNFGFITKIENAYAKVQVVCDGINKLNFITKVYLEENEEKLDLNIYVNQIKQYKELILFQSKEEKNKE